MSGQPEEASRLFALLGRLEDAVITTTLDGVITSWNRGAEELYGYTADEMVGSDIRRLYSIDSANDVDKALESIRHGETVAVPSGIRQRRDGSIIHVEVHVSPMLDDAGQPFGAFAIVRDVTEREARDEELRRSRKILQRTQEIAKIGGFETRIGPEQVLQLTTEAYAIFGIEPGREIRNIDFYRIVHPDDVELVVETVIRSRAEFGQRECEVRIIRPDGAERWIVMVVDVVTDDDGVAVGATGLIQDITERKIAAANLERDALYDRLTGLSNRLLFSDRLMRALIRAQDSRRRVAVFYIDLDRFKLVNDTRGEEVGDELLRAVAERLLATVRPTDTVSRYAADEFVILCEGMVTLTSAAEQALRLLELFEAPFVLSSGEQFVSASIGVTLSEAGQTAADLIRDAGLAMYEAKERGRGRVEIYDLGLREQTEHRVALEEGLRRALASDELFLEFQPILSLHTGRCIGAEALVRWASSSGAVIYPSEFIELAEETGLIVPIGRWVIDQACQVLGEWQRASDAGPLRMSINISPAQLRDLSLSKIVGSAISVAEIEASAIRLELTESVLIEHQLDQPLLRSLRGTGARLSIDDFGTRYSALGYLTRLPVDELKIDKVFIVNAVTDEAERAVISAIVALGHAIGLDVVAEGIESEEQLNLVRELGCDFAQGYFISVPLGADACFEVLKREPR